MMLYERNRISSDFSVRGSFSTRDSILSRTRASILSRIDVASSSSRTSRTSSRRRIVVTIEVDETFTAAEPDNDENKESVNENDEELSNCIKCCRVLVSCRRIAGIACARCARQKQTCISIRF
jgi:hypothetical protein